MDISLIIGIIIFIAVAVLIIKLIKNTLKAALYIVGLIIILLIIGSSFLYLDISGFRENFGKTPNLYLLEKDGEIIAGAKGIFLRNQDPSFIEKDMLASYGQSFQENDLKSIKGDNYRLFILKSEIFDSVQQVRADNDTLSRQKIFELLGSETPVNDYLLYKGISIDQKDYLLDQLKLKDSTEFKGLLFVLLFKTSIEKNGPRFIFDQYKKGGIVIYPESALFKSVRLLPSSFLGKYLALEEEK